MRLRNKSLSGRNTGAITVTFRLTNWNKQQNGMPNDAVSLRFLFLEACDSVLALTVVTFLIILGAIPHAGERRCSPGVHRIEYECAFALGTGAKWNRAGQ